MSRRGTLALAAGTAFVGALAVARPVLDAFVARTEDRMCPLLPQSALPPGEGAIALHETLRVADLHADSLLFGRDLLRRAAHAHVMARRWR